MTIDIHRFGFKDQAYVKHDDHEAEVRIRTRDAEKIGIEICMTQLRWECRKHGMSQEDVDRQDDFRGLLAALVEHVAKVPVGIDNPCAELAHAGWKFSTYHAGGSWQVWAKHPLGGGIQIAILPSSNRTGYSNKATAEAIVKLLSGEKTT